MEHKRLFGGGGGVTFIQQGGSTKNKFCVWVKKREEKEMYRSVKKGEKGLVTRRRRKRVKRKGRDAL